MISRKARYLAAVMTLGLAASVHAGTATVSPALAACSKALIETIAKAETLPAYSIKAPSPFTANSLYDQNSFTVFAKTAKSKTLLAKAACKATPDGTIVSFRSIPVKS